MALFVKQQDDRSELQNRLATELQQRAKDRAKHADRPDGVDDSQYVSDIKKTTSLAWVRVFFVVAVMVLLIYLISTVLA